MRKVSLFLFCIHPSKFYRRHETVMIQTFQWTAAEDGSASACQSGSGGTLVQTVCGLDVSSRVESKIRGLEACHR